jgi:tRNA(fMet)-specific endonuclease VapC
MINRFLLSLEAESTTESLLLDTDIWIEVIRKEAKAVQWFKVQHDPILSGIAAIEGAFGSQSASELQEVLKKQSSLRILWPIDDDFKKATIELSQYKLLHGMGILDAVLASSAIRCNLPLATFNVKHFRAIPGLKIVQPYER